MLKFSPRCRAVCRGDGNRLYIESQLLNRLKSVTVNFLARRVAECQTVTKLDFLAYISTAQLLIVCGDHAAVEGDATINQMAVRMRFVEMPGHDILRIGDPHAPKPFIDELRHEAVALLIVGEPMCILRRE